MSTIERMKCFLVKSLQKLSDREKARACLECQKHVVSINPLAKMDPHLFHSPAHGTLAGPVGPGEHAQALNGL